jgi:hypothetical protein
MNTSVVRSKFASTKTFWLLIAMVVLSVFLRDMPGFAFLLAPFNQFQVLLHEASHALACVFTGGWVSGLTIVEDGNGHGGLTFTHGGIPFIYAQAGYMGEVIWGCLLIALSRFPRISRAILIAIGVLIGLVSIWFMPAGIFTPAPGMILQTLGSLVWGLVMAGVLVWVGRKFSGTWAHLILTFLAVQSCMSSLSGVWVLLLQSMGAFPGTWSDATNMARMTGIPAMFWGVSWALFSVGMMSWTLWMSYKADQQVPEKRAVAGHVNPKQIDTAAQIEHDLIELRHDVEQGQSINIKQKPKQYQDQNRNQKRYR